MSSFKLLSISVIIFCVLAMYMKTLENHHSSWRFVATNLGFRISVQLYKAFISLGLTTKKHPCSLELQLMDDIFRNFVKPDYTNHAISSAKSLLTQTRTGRKGFLQITLPPIWDTQHSTIEEDTIAHTRVLWVNKDSISNGVIISLHGGAYIAGSAESCLPYLLPLSKYSNWSALSIHYSLSPEVQLPHQVDEVLRVYTYLLDDMHIDNKKIAIVGDSAGGSLLILFIQQLIAHKQLDRLPLCGITMSSWDVPSTGDSYASNRERDSLMDDRTGKVWGHFAVGNIDIDGNIVETDKNAFDSNMNDNDAVSYLHKNNVWTFEQFPPLFLSVSEWECVLDDSVRVKMEMDKYVERGGSECLLHVTESTGIHVLEDFYAHGIIEAETLIQKEAQWILKHSNSASA